ncbi:MAG TPA: hypothetical protein VK524_16580, partial [Polyangiaceae bacterium]|nr:hypothetical protein [Polyangiaceae bacterium]
QAQRVHPQYDEDVAAIPMKKSNPMVLLAVVGGAVLVLGVAAFSFFGGKKTAPAPAATAALVNQADEAAKAKAMREHVELTQRSLAKLEGEPAAKKEAPAAEAPSEPAQPAQPAARETAPPKRTASARSASAPRTKTAAAPAPQPAKRPVPKKSLDSLDDLGKGIASELGK